MDQLRFVKKSQKSIASIENLALALNFPLIDIERALELPVEQRYIPFPAPGGTRIVNKVHPLIATLQRRIKNRILVELVEYPNYIFGSIRDEINPRDYINCAKQHCLAKSLSKIDISGFFDNIQYDAIYDIFEKLFHFPAEVCDVLSNITTKNGTLPQGAPSSSHLATLVFYDSEHKVVQNAKSRGLIYTRLMDDITISSKTEQYDFRAIRSRVIQMIEGKYLTINEGKSTTHAQINSQVLVHGLRVNCATPALSDKNKSKIRALVHKLEIAASLPNGRTFESYRRLYDHTSGSLTILKRLEHPKYYHYRKRLREILPLPSPAYMNQLWAVFGSLSCSPEQRVYGWYQTRFYMLQNRLNIAQRIYKAEAADIRARLREMRPV